jgi:Trk K+ transport system NAD-binding subunit
MIGRAERSPSSKLSRRRRADGRRRKLRAGIRDTLLLLREFGWPLLLFGATMVGGGLSYAALAERAGQPLDGLVTAVYLVLTATFLQPITEFPDVWYLQLYYFLMPVIGIGILAQGLADFGVLFFNRRARSKEREMAVASTLNQHVVLIGLGHLGYRVMHNLVNLDQDVVVIELSPKTDLADAARALDVPVIQDDGKREAALLAAGIDKARALVTCTQNDSLNLQIAFKARRLNPDIQVVLRIFDDEFAEALQSQFGFRAMSATLMAAPTFAAAAAGVDITRPLTVEGESFSLARLDVLPATSLVGRALADVEQTYDVSVVLLRRDGESDFHPAGTRTLAGGDVIAVLGGPEQISRIVNSG